MSCRTGVIAITALLVVVGGARVASAEDYLNLKVGFPINGVEYEHVMSNGVAFSVTGSYWGLSTTLDKDTRDTYRIIGGGLKKYYGGHRGFYLAVYPEVLHVSKEIHATVPGFLFVSTSDFDGSANATVFMLHGGPGWRFVVGRTTFGVEAGAGVLVPGSVKVDGIYRGGEEGATPLTAYPGVFNADYLDTRETPVGGMVSVQLYVGYKF